MGVTDVCLKLLARLHSGGLVPDQPFASMKKDARWLASVVTLTCLLLFALITPFAPSGAGAPAPDSFHFSAGWYQAIQALITAVLSVGLLSLLFETFLRESHGRDLSRYLKLRTAMVASGIDQVVPEGEFQWQPLLADATEVRALLRDPSTWLPAQQQVVFQLARKHAVSFTVAIPDEDGPNVEAVAKSLGYEKDSFKAQLVASRRLLETTWANSQSGLKAGTSFRVVSYSFLPTYEVVTANKKVAVMLGAAQADAAVGERLIMAFDSPSHASYPGDWLMAQVRNLDALTSTWEKVIP